MKNIFKFEDELSNQGFLISKIDNITQAELLCQMTFGLACYAIEMMQNA